MNSFPHGLRALLYSGLVMLAGVAAIDTCKDLLLMC